MAFRFETLCDGESPKSSPSVASHKDTGPAIDRREATLRNEVEFHPRSSLREFSAGSAASKARVKTTSNTKTTSGHSSRTAGT